MNALTPTHLLVFRYSADIYSKLSTEERQKLLQRWNSWADELQTKGKLHSGQPLENEGRLVLEVNGAIVDGPFAESKEVIGGFFLLAVDSLAEATEIAKGCPSLSLGLTVEVRTASAACQELRVKSKSALAFTNA